MDTARIDGQCYGILPDSTWEKVTYDQYKEIREYMRLNIKVKFIEYERRCGQK